MSRSPDVVVVGGGVAGLASAWRLAQAGGAVTLLDPSPGGGASGVAAGMLAPVTEARLGEEALLRLSLASWAQWPDFAAEVEEASGRRIGYRADGTLVVAVDADDRVALDELVDRQRELGLEVTSLGGRQGRRLEPGLTPGIRGAALAVSEGSVDPPVLVEALALAAERAGVVIRRAAVARLAFSGGDDRRAGPIDPAARVEGGRVDGVVLDDGERRVADTVVLAAGSWSGRVGGLPAVAQPPVRPVKGQVVTLRQRPADPLIAHTLRGFVRGSVVYLVPRDDGRVVIGATTEERGWDTTVTAGGTYELLRDGRALVPGLDDAELVGVRAGLRPATPDDLPLIGRGAVDGLILATGHYRNGILLAPVTAEAVVAAVLDDPVAAEIVPCDPRRFGVPPDRAGGAGSIGRDDLDRVRQPLPRVGTHPSRGVAHTTDGGWG